MDTFAKDVPAFSVEGEGKIKSAIGGCVTFFVFALTLAFTVIKFSHLTAKANPTINKLTIPAHYSALDKVQLDDINFRLAFTVEGFLERKRRDDPRYVKWFA